MQDTIKYSIDRMKECRCTHPDAGYFSSYTGESQMAKFKQLWADLGKDPQEISEEHIMPSVNIGWYFSQSHPEGSLPVQLFGIIGGYLVHPDCYYVGCNRCSDERATPEDHKAFDAARNLLEKCPDYPAK